MDLSLIQKICILVLRALGLSSERIAICLNYLNEKELTDFLWWIENQMELLQRDPYQWEVIGEISKRIQESEKGKESKRRMSQQYDMEEATKQ